MAGNNQINSITNSYGWTYFSTIITSTGSYPTLGSGSTIQSYYLQQGKLLLLTLSITGVLSGSTNGTGTYLFNLPSGFTINNSIVTFPLSNFSLGSSSTYSQSNNDFGTGIALANDVTHYALYVYSKLGGTSN
ncbi:MAG: hypothetical protein K2X37_04710, partial [Chitinophagaceae bacterium]|nr:hypothetical protein [Chitinophagaceae bacterium]